ncbi:spermidine/putrescine ABC transporter permease [Nibricoccus aquaticus]|uniref:Spermidine/putrescine ABC transporter permease n=1 Tax=Nibricoccus aquaticus TaxID=2576891 RepID=A0A290QHL1_9BACT|nr:sugar ABC transporter permease [Nibricoccus aquaticus]ATC63841.1 spermidine/putrescine ABC transporter permease [Nibricoccus aquaticus]
MTPRERKNFFAGLGFTSLWIVGLGVFTAYPVIASLYYSFCDYSILKSAVWIGGENYQELVGDALFWKSLGNTLVFAALSVPLGTAVALGLAMLLNCDVRGRPFFRVVFYLPSIVPVVASSMLWLWIFNGEYGLLNGVLAPVLGWFGLTPPAWFADPAWSKPALVIMSLWGVGNAMVIYLTGLQNVPKELYEAAEIDGASAWKRFRHVTLPCIAPVVYFNVVMGLIGAMQVFAQAFIISDAANGGTGTHDGAPARSLLFYTMYLFTTAFHDLRMGYASAMAYVLFIVIAVLTWMATRLSRGNAE